MTASRIARRRGVGRADERAGRLPAALIREILQEVLETKMDEALGAEKASEQRPVEATDRAITAERW
jgi:hypothetical protein